MSVVSRDTFCSVSDCAARNTLDAVGIFSKLMLFTYFLTNCVLLSKVAFKKTAKCNLDS